MLAPEVFGVRAPTEPDDIAVVLDALPFVIERVQETGGAESSWALFQPGSPRPRTGRHAQASPSALHDSMLVPLDSEAERPPRSKHSHFAGGR